MRIIRYEHAGQVGYGLLEEGIVYPVAGDIFGQFGRGAGQVALDRVRLLAPCEPSKIVCVGRNYAAHAAEMGGDVPAEPQVFLKPPSAVIGPEAAIAYPAMSQQVDYEGELAVVVGRRARHVAEADALHHVLGYTVGNDVTARDLQRRDSILIRAKGFDTFCPLGPWIETDLDAGDLHIETRVNGIVKQSGRTGEMLFGVPKLISFISHIMTLLPGDVILTGTPSGIGPVVPGDVIEVEVERIGVLRNPVEDGR